MRFASVCTGIGATELAFGSLGWEPVWFSEIAKFPSAVLAHHYPNVPNLGDMTEIHESEVFKNESIDLIIGGTPCQSFSIAGLRKGLADPRGNLMLVYLSILDRVRPRWMVWENVPGVLSTDGGRDFGAFFGGLGQIGYGFAYRVLDAQYFGVAQRRRRVFVVGYLGNWRTAAAVLFERESLCGHPPPSRKTGEGVAGAFEDGVTTGGYDPGAAIGGLIPEQVAATLRSGGDGGLPSSRGEHIVVVPETAGTITEGMARRRGGGQAEGAANGHLVPIIMATGQGSAEVVSDCEQSLTCNHEAPIVCFDCKAGSYAAKPSTEVAHTLRSMNAVNRNQSGGGHLAVVVRTAQTSANGHGIAEEVSHPLDGANGQAAIAMQSRLINENPDSGPQKPGFQEDIAFTMDARPQPQAVAFTQNQEGDVLAGEVFPSMGTNSNATGRNTPKVMTPTHAVRRLTPRECERLQGFPDDFTLIPWRKKLATDTPRYAALGNSMAVPVVQWIGERIDPVEKAMTHNKGE